MAAFGTARSALLCWRAASAITTLAQTWHWRRTPHKGLKSPFSLLQASLQNLTSDVKKPEHVHRETSDCHVYYHFSFHSIPASVSSHPMSLFLLLCASVQSGRDPFYSVIVCSVASRNLRLDYSSKVLFWQK